MPRSTHVAGKGTAVEVAGCAGSSCSDVAAGRSGIATRHSLVSEHKKNRRQDRNGRLWLARLEERHEHGRLRGSPVLPATGGALQVRAAPDRLASSVQEWAGVLRRTGVKARGRLGSHAHVCVSITRCCKVCKGEKCALARNQGAASRGNVPRCQKYKCASSAAAATAPAGDGLNARSARCAATYCQSAGWCAGLCFRQARAAWMRAASGGGSASTRASGSGATCTHGAPPLPLLPLSPLLPLPPLLSVLRRVLAGLSGEVKPQACSCLRFQRRCWRRCAARQAA